MDAVQIRVSRDMNIDGSGTRTELARADAMGHMRVAVGHACVPGREWRRGGLLGLASPVQSDSGINPVLFLPFSPPFLPSHHLAPLDMPGDILKKRKIAVLGSRSVGEPGKSLLYSIICSSLRLLHQESRPS